MVLEVIMKIVSALLSIYILLIFIRILLTWFQGPYLGKPMEILIAVTEPYLAYFRRFTIFRAANIDFSPIAGIIVLVILQNITSTIARVGSISIGIILGIIVSAVWSAFSFILVLFLILMIVRLLGFAFRVNPVSPIWQTLDFIIQPVVLPISNFLSGNRPLPYPTRIAIGGAVLLVGFLVLRFIMHLVIQLLMGLPF